MTDAIEKLSKRERRLLALAVTTKVIRTPTSGNVFDKLVQRTLLEPDGGITDLGREALKAPVDENNHGDTDQKCTTAGHSINGPYTREQATATGSPVRSGKVPEIRQQHPRKNR